MISTRDVALFIGTTTSSVALTGTPAVQPTGWTGSFGGKPLRIERDGYIPDQPDQLIVVTATGGGPIQNEGLFDRATIQIRTRGDQRDPDGAEALMTAVDRALINAAPPLRIGGKPVKMIDYIGGPPAFAGDDQAQRRAFICNYVIEIARA